MAAAAAGFLVDFAAAWVGTIWLALALDWD